MLDIFRSDTDGQYYINGKLLKHCFFCGSALFPEDIECTEEDMSIWLNKFNQFTRKKAQIGKVILCQRCTADIIDIYRLDRTY